MRSRSGCRSGAGCEPQPRGLTACRSCGAPPKCCWPGFGGALDLTRLRSLRNASTHSGGSSIESTRRIRPHRSSRSTRHSLSGRKRASMRSVPSSSEAVPPGSSRGLPADVPPMLALAANWATNRPQEVGGRFAVLGTLRGAPLEMRFKLALRHAALALARPAGDRAYRRPTASRADLSQREQQQEQRHIEVSGRKR